MALTIKQRFVNNVTRRFPWLPKKAVLPLAVALVVLPTLSVLAFSYGPMISVQPENGSLSGGTSVVSDVNASGSQSLKFGSTPTCNLNATTATFGAQVAAATNGQTVCLASGDYGTWLGTDKSITIREQSGATVSLGLEVREEDANFTLDGLTLNSALFLNYAYSPGEGPKNITVKNSEFTSSVLFDGPVNSNIVLDNNTHMNINFAGPNNAVTCGDTPAAIHFPYSSPFGTSGVTVKNSLFKGGNKDGIQNGIGLNIIDNVFDDIGEHGAVCGDYADTPHTDSIQILGAAGTVVRGNTFKNVVTGIVAYDGIENATIENNLIETVNRPEGIELLSDTNSIVRRNTLVYKSGCGNGSNECGVIFVGSKTGSPGSSGTVIEDNIATEISVQSGSNLSVSRYNMLRNGASGTNFIGIPSYTGGATPTTRNGFFLNAGSPGKNASSAGNDVGIY